ncbi:MAG: hypothetical protein JWP27_777 [Flaviaesturariibacter sp.]|nr:hypothetical protein [Flaviaesturariibacter sp.]
MLAMTFDLVLLMIFAVNILFFCALTFKKHAVRKSKPDFYGEYLHSN